MASPVAAPYRTFHDEPHWTKLKNSVFDLNTKAALRILRSYSGRPIGEKLDQFLFQLIDERNSKAILCLVSAMRTALRLTELSVVCELGAANALKQKPFQRYNNLPLIAERFAKDFRTYEGEEWKGRVAFIEALVLRPQ